MKKINTQTRQDLVKVINALPNDGATNIGGGLYMGMDVRYSFKFMIQVSFFALQLINIIYYCADTK